MNAQQAFDAGFEAVKGYVDRAFAGLDERIFHVEQRASSASAKLPAGVDGEAFGTEMAAIVRSYVERQLAPLQQRLADAEKALEDVQQHLTKPEGKR